MEPRGRNVLLSAFDRLFDRAVSKLRLECAVQEKDEAKRQFAERYDGALKLVDQVELTEIPEMAMTRMEAAIDELTPAQLASYLAAGPLAVQVHELMRTIALRAAEQRLLKHFASQADDTYGGN